MAKSTYDVYVSYARTDADFVQKLTRALRSRGLHVWYYEQELRIGDIFMREIEAGLERSRFFLLVVSPDYLSGAWTNFEMGVALSHGAATARTGIIPVFAREVDPKLLPPWIRPLTGFHAKDMSIEQLADAVTRIVNPDRVTAKA